MSNAALIHSQLQAPLRSLALTVEETGPGVFRWRILERNCQAQAFVFESVACSADSFVAYDTALATGYGELQRLIGPDLQYGPRVESMPASSNRAGLAGSATPRELAA